MAIDTNNHQQRVEAELANFKSEFLEKSQNGPVNTPAVWPWVERVIAQKIQAATGQPNGIRFVIHELNKRSNPRFLSLGAGTCALETQRILPHLDYPQNCTLECIDLNADIMELGRQGAEQTGTHFIATAMDINQIHLEPNSYDIILVWAALHHFVELYHIAAEINQGLKPDGLFITMDICSRNGFLLWSETEKVVNRFWQELPERYRYAHTLGPEPVLCDTYPNVDCAQSGFECIRSEEIIPALSEHLDLIHFVPAHALARRFFDTMFGPNFDLQRTFDLSFFLKIILYDELALSRLELQPETFFGVYQKKIE